MYQLEFLTDGSADVGNVPIDSIMFVDVLQNLSSIMDTGGPYKLELDVKKQILSEYKSRDLAFSGGIDSNLHVNDELLPMDQSEYRCKKRKRAMVSVLNPVF